jgi:signal transduction histidine kinase
VSLYEASDQQPFLAARPPSRLQRQLAYGVMAFLVAAFCITLPYASLQLPIVTAFVPINATVVIINNLITAALLAAQFWVVRRAWLLVLACGFFFTALMFVPFALTFPGVFTPSGLLGAGIQSTAWIGITTYLGSPLALIVAILVRDAPETTGTVQRSPGRAIVLSFVLVAAIVGGLTWAIIANDKFLPQVFLRWDSLRPYRSVIPQDTTVIALDIIALVLLWRKGQSVLDLWLMVMCCAWLFVMTAGALFAGSRYSLGFYAGRTVHMAATFFILLLFLSETTMLYASLARATLQRRSARHARQIAMDVMAVSLGHEIRQPLTAVLANAETGMLLLGKAEPNLNEVRATLASIDADGRRISDIIGGVRTMFKGSAHHRQPLDLNKVIRDALAALDLELRQQRVIVKTDLDNDLPPVLADSGQLHQMFLNLITNALEAMAAVANRPSVLRLTSGIVADTSDVAVTVEDSGVGIADEDSGRILEPFFSTKVAGTGVGLTICKVVIEAHGGSLQACANEPYGTIFRVILPKGDDD